MPRWVCNGPLEAVTAAEARAVAVSVQLGESHRIVGGDGIPLVTAHSTRMTDVDRRLAAGEAGVSPRLCGPPQKTRTGAREIG